MMRFLYIIAGPFPMLLHGDAVFEILTIDNKVSSNGHLQWRDKVLPIVSASSLLELTPLPQDSEELGVVYRCYEAQPPILLLVSQVICLLTLQAKHFAPLPTVPTKARGLFDAIYIDQQQARQVYRLRSDPEHKQLEQIMACS